ncbi:MAG: transcription antitermination factor NusB [Clostridia bacterium]|nr:transcription antitermination factor NusB [Clostridia bacterium]
MDRKIARAHAMKLIYEWEMGGDGGEDTRMNLLGVEPGEREAEFMNRMFEGVVVNEEKLDAGIAAHLRGWTLERISKVDLAILRLGAYELMLGELPAGIIINEAVELANQYSSEKAGSFINGVLGSLSRAEAE